MSGNSKRVTVLAFVALVALSAPSFAADRPVPVYKAPPPPVVYGWTGFYVGANIGYSWGRASSNWDIFAPFVLGGPCSAPPASGALCSAGSDSNRLNGAIGGLQAGYNWQNGNFLAGLETDIQWSGQKGNGLFTSTFLTAAAGVNGVVAIDQSVKLQWLGTLRGRTGITFDRWLVYGTGGLAYGAVKVEGERDRVAQRPRAYSRLPGRLPVHTVRQLEQHAYQGGLGCRSRHRRSLGRRLDREARISSRRSGHRRDRFCHAARIVRQL
jgi:opacity protein-like surface antigen